MCEVKRSLIFYCDRKFEWARQACIVWCTRNVRSRLERFKTGVWKQRMRDGVRKGDYFYIQRKMIYIAYIIKLSGNEEVEGTVFNRI
jgi:hypothetical protein